MKRIKKIKETTIKKTIVFLILLMLPIILLSLSKVDKALFDYKITKMLLTISFFDENCGESIFEKKETSLKIYNLKLNDGMSKCVINKLKGKKNLHIVNSNGGRVIESLILAEYINKNHISVTIEKSCISACVAIVVSAIENEMCNSAILGTHSAGLLTNNSMLQYYLKPFVEITNDFEIKYFEEYGVNNKHYSKILKNTSFNDIYIMNAKESYENGYIKKIKTCTNNQLNFSINKNILKSL